MNLVEILAREWSVWPVQDHLPISQDGYGGYGGLYVSCVFTESGNTMRLDEEFEIADDMATAEVTRAQWAEERERIAAEESPTWHIGQEDESWRAECEKQYEQELWDKVAVASMNGLISCDAFHGGLYQQNPENAAIFGADCADAFMAERAKRLKERA